MNSKEFVSVIELVVRDSAIESTIANLSKPSGRKPPQNIVRASNWFKDLDDGAKEQLLFIIQLAVNRSVFGMLAVLDGVRQIESTEEKGHLELYHVQAGGKGKELLNKPEGEMLHDLFNALKPNK